MLELEYPQKCALRFPSILLCNLSCNSKIEPLIVPEYNNHSNVSSPFLFASIRVWNLILGFSLANCSTIIISPIYWTVCHLFLLRVFEIDITRLICFQCSIVNKICIYEICISLHSVFIYILHSINYFWGCTFAVISLCRYINCQAPCQLWFYNSSWRLLRSLFSLILIVQESKTRHCAAQQMSVPLSVSLVFQMTVDQPHQLQIWKWYVC